MYDVIIIGAGVIGASIARELSKYDLKVLILEKEADVGDGASGANSGIIHSGYDPLPNTNKAYYNRLGNQMFKSLCTELNVKIEPIGSITVATNQEEVALLYELEKRAQSNKIKTYILEKEEIIKTEPNITKNVIKALYAPSCKIVDPFNLTVALIENAIDNGVELLLDSEVINITKEKYYYIHTSDNQFKAKFIINASGASSDSINNLINKNKIKLAYRKGEYFVLDHFDNNFVNHVIFGMPSKTGKGVLITPTISGNYLIGPSNDLVFDKDDLSTSKDSLNKVMKRAEKLLHFIPKDQIIRRFSGIRNICGEDFIIEEKNNFINLIGICSPGLASSPAIADQVIEFINNKVKLIPKTNFNPNRRKHIKMQNLNDYEKANIIKKDPRYGRIICRCEHISEGEILDYLNRSNPPTTIKGIKKRLRPGFGKCQGGFCEPLVIDILSKFFNRRPELITLKGKDSFILRQDHYEKL